MSSIVSNDCMQILLFPYFPPPTLHTPYAPAAHLEIDKSLGLPLGLQRELAHDCPPHLHTVNQELEVRIGFAVQVRGYHAHALREGCRESHWMSNRGVLRRGEVPWLNFATSAIDKMTETRPYYWGARRHKTSRPGRKTWSNHGLNMDVIYQDQSDLDIWL